MDSENEGLTAKGHHYNTKTIQQALELMIDCGISFRGIEKVFNLFGDLDSQTTPSFSSVRKWLARIGIYELTREKEHRDDWIFIVDFTLELGKQKALVILGVPQDKFIEIVANNKKGLSHENVEVLAIEIMNSTRGEFIEKALDRVSEKVGVPIQIVADNSSDLARGIKLYSQKYPNLIYTHDVTHGMALLLKYQLDSNDRYQSFIKRCTITRQRLQQTELYFLAPPAQRSQCRYFNIERLTDWGINLLNSSTETLMELLPNVDDSVILPKIKDKLGWLANFQSDLMHWSQMASLTRSVETQLKSQGINQKSLKIFEKSQLIFTDANLQNFQQKLREYITTQSEKIQDERTFLATSDVIESLFGKYKQFSTRCPFKEMGQMLLTICISTMDLTTTVIKNALETISFEDVEAWLEEVFGQSMLSKRRALFSTAADTKTV